MGLYILGEEGCSGGRWMIIKQCGNLRRWSCVFQVGRANEITTIHIKGLCPFSCDPNKRFR